ncbi:MAG: NAD(P)/FAD-dependent oxidoreductase [Thermoplasmata archaeon]
MVLQSPRYHDKRRCTNAGIIPYKHDLTSFASKGFGNVGDSAGLTNPATGGGIYCIGQQKVAGESACKAIEFERADLMLDYHNRISR